MTRLLGAVLVLLVSLPAFAATQIAPLQPRFGDMIGGDDSPHAATDGTTTFVVWTKTSFISPRLLDIYGARVAPDGALVGMPFVISSVGRSAAIATDGSRFVIAYAFVTSRFDAGVQVAVRSLDRDGTLGDERVVLVSATAADTAFIRSIIWTGRGWIINATGTDRSRLIFLDRDLNAKTTLAADGFGDVAMIGTRVFWTRYTVADSTLHVDEIVNDSIAAVSSQAINGFAHRTVATPSSLITEYASAVGNPKFSINLIAFSPDSGWSSPASWTGEFKGLSPYGSGAIVFAGSPLYAAAVDEQGKLGSIVQVLDADVTSVDLAPNGLLFVSMNTPANLVRPSGTALLAFRMPSLAPLRTDSGHLISLARIDAQSQPLICSEGSYAIAFWNQTIDDNGTMAAFSRRIDASGNPVGDVHQLPFTIGVQQRIACGATRDIITWQNRAVAVTADGTSASNLVDTPFSIASIAAADDRFFAVGVLSNLVGTPMNADATPVVPNGFPLLPSIRSQGNPSIARIGSNFIVTWKEDDLIGAMVLSPEGTPSNVKMIGTDMNALPVIAGDEESALAGWLTSKASPILVAFDKNGGSFDLFDPHWGGGYTSMLIRPTIVRPSHYFVGLLKGTALVIGETGQNGSFITELNATSPITDVWYQSLDFVSVAGRPVAIWEHDNRVYVGSPAGKQRAIHH